MFIFVFAFSNISLFAVEYCSVGSNAEFIAYTFDGKYYLVLSFKDSEDHHLTSSTIVKFMLNDGTILRFDGTSEASSINSSSSSIITNWGHGIASGYTFDSSSQKHYVIFPITQEQIDSLQTGVDRVTINTIPKVYKRSKWAGKKNFGNNLYKDFKCIFDEFTDEPYNY